MKNKILEHCTSSDQDIYYKDWIFQNDYDTFTLLQILWFLEDLEYNEYKTFFSDNLHQIIKEN